MSGTARKYSALAVLFVAFAVTIGWRAYALRDLEERTFLLPSGFPATEITRKRVTPAVAAILLHGFQCNRIMMIELGRYLAYAGIRIFLIDLPGHGASSLRFVDTAVGDQSTRAYSELVDGYGISPATTALVGHSFGSVPLISVTAANPSSFASVFIGPGYYGGASGDQPRNVLVLTGERDHSYIVDAASRLLTDATNGKGLQVGQSFGEPPLLRQWESVPGAGHLALLYNRAAFEATLNWIRRTQIVQGGTFRTQFKAHESSRNAHDPRGDDDASAQSRAAGSSLTAGRSFVAVCGVPAALGLLFFVAIVAALSPRPPTPTISRELTSSGQPPEILLLLLTTPLSAFWVSYLDPLAAQHILEGSVIVSTLVVSGLLAGGALVLSARGGSGAPISAHVFRVSLSNVAIAIAFFGVLYLVARFTVSNDFYDLSLKLTPRRISAFVLFSSCSIVFFLVAGHMLARVHGRLLATTIGAPLRILITTLTIVGVALFLPLCLLIIGTTLQRFFAPIAVILLLLLGLQSMVLELSRDNRPCAILGGLVVGWVTSVGFLTY